MLGMLKKVLKRDIKEAGEAPLTNVTLLALLDAEEAEQAAYIKWMEELGAGAETD